MTARPVEGAHDEAITRIHARLDTLFEEMQELAKLIGAVREQLAAIIERCGPCQATLQRHETTLHGKNGIVQQVAVLKEGRVDTLSVKSVIALVGAIGTLAATIGAAMAAFAK